MARPWRIEYGGAVYQVISVGNGSQRIFIEDEDIDDFMSLLHHINKRFSIDIFGYLAMPRYYKLLIKTHLANLSKAMQWFGATYTRRYNIRNQTRGHLFQGRFKSVVIENDKYLTRLSCEMHCEPVRAQLVDHLIHYPHSSYTAYAYQETLPPVWLNTTPILSRSTSPDRYRAYRRKVQYHLENDIRYDKRDFAHGLIFGSSSFAKQIKKRFLPQMPHSEIPQQRHFYRQELHQMAARLARIVKCDINQFRDSLRISSTQKNSRNMIIYFLWNSGLFTNQQIGDLFGLSYSMVSRAVSDYRNEISYDDGLRSRTAKIEAQLGF